MYGVWEEDEPMCDQYVTSRLIELEVMVAAYFLRPLVPLISLRLPRPWGLQHSYSHSLHVHFLMKK